MNEIRILNNPGRFVPKPKEQKLFFCFTKGQEVFKIETPYKKGMFVTPSEIEGLCKMAFPDMELPNLWSNGYWE